MTEITNELILAELTDHPTMPLDAYNWHSGGGIFCVRLDVAPNGGKADHSTEEGPPHLLLTPRTEWDGGDGVMVGYYPRWDDEGNWPGTSEPRFCALEDVYAVVCEGADLLSRAGGAPVRCDRCGDVSNSAPGLQCGRVDAEGAEPCRGTYR
jgi:hypothetical protein